MNKLIIVFMVVSTIVLGYLLYRNYVVANYLELVNTNLDSIDHNIMK